MEDHWSKKTGQRTPVSRSQHLCCNNHEKKETKNTGNSLHSLTGHIKDWRPNSCWTKPKSSPSPAVQNKLWNGKPNIFTEWSGLRPVYHERAYHTSSTCQYHILTTLSVVSLHQRGKNNIIFLDTTHFSDWAISKILLEGRFNPKDIPIWTRKLHLNSPTPRQTSPPIALAPIYQQYDPPKPPLPFGLVYVSQLFRFAKSTQFHHTSKLSTWSMLHVLNAFSSESTTLQYL